MTRAGYPKTHEYCFELTIEITSAFSMAAGEIGMLVSEGLFALDEQGALFPGVGSPEPLARLLTAKATAIGYASRGRDAPTGNAYRRLRESEVPPASPDAHLFQALYAALIGVDGATRRHRMMMAKLLAAADRCRHATPTPLGDADRVAAEALVSAAYQMVTAVDAATKPVL